MTNIEKLKSKINEKITTEQAAFNKELLQLQKEQILEKAYEFAIRENLAATLPDFIENFDEDELSVLAQLNSILGTLYKCWMESDCSLQEMLEDIVMDVVRTNMPE